MRRIAERLPLLAVRISMKLPLFLLAPFAPSYGVVCQKRCLPQQIDVERTATLGTPVLAPSAEQNVLFGMKPRENRG